MQSLAATAEYRAGDLDVESEYYRIHYRPALRAPELLDRLMPRLRANFTPERVLTARAIEDRLYEQTWSSAGYDLLPTLRRLAVPTLVLHGEDDFVPVDLATHVADAIPAARLAVLPQCGHFAYLEAPDAVMQHVSELFAAAPTAPRSRPATSGSAEQILPAAGPGWRRDGGGRPAWDRAVSGGSGSV
jgi:proline iminopeptidase